MYSETCSPRDVATRLLGAPLFDPAPSVVKLTRMKEIYEQCRQHLQQFPQAALPVDDELQFVTDYWVYQFDEVATETAGDSVSDLLFLTRCHLLCCRDVHTRDMAQLNDIHELYVKLQVAGSNHTRRRFEQRDSALEMEQLEKRVASFVVYCMSDNPQQLLKKIDALPPIDPILAAVVEGLRNIPDPTTKEERALSKEEQQRQDELKQLEKEHFIPPDGIHAGFSVAEEDAADDYDVNAGSFWHTDRQTVVTGFLSMASRVFRDYWLQRMVFQQYPIRSQSLPVYSKHVEECFLAWFKDVCERDYHDSKGVNIYRDLVFDHWLPAGSRQELLRTLAFKFDVVQPLNLLEQQLGVDSTAALANIARTKVKLVSQDTKHEVYEFLVLAQFSYMLSHKCQGTAFLKDYYIQPTELGKYFPRLRCQKSWGLQRRPLLLRLLRQWWIHDKGEWIPCTSIVDALLKMMVLWSSEEYNAMLATGVSIKHYIDALTTKTNEEEYM